MSFRTDSKPFPQAPTKLDYDASESLLAWAQIEPEENELMAAGARRNVLRHAEAWGPHLIALLSAHGYLKPAGDPLEALERLLDEVNGDTLPPPPTGRLTKVEVDDAECLIPIKEFIEDMDCGLTEDDGSGVYATATHYTDLPINRHELREGRTNGYTHVMWFNK